MIVEFFLNLFKTLVNMLLTPLSFVLQPLGSMAGFIELMAYASMFIPMFVFGQCLGLWLAYQTIKFGMVVINWIIAKIPTIE